MSIVTLATNKVARNATATAAAPAKPISDVLTAVAAYVPTEVIAAYTLALAVAVDDVPTNGSTTAPGLPMFWFLVFLACTPLFVWLVYAVRSKEENNDYVNPKLWPWWESIAACIAFTVWSAALPKSAFQVFTWYDSKISAVVLMLVSGLLPLVGRVVTVTKKPSKPPK